MIRAQCQLQTRMMNACNFSDEFQLEPKFTTLGEKVNSTYVYYCQNQHIYAK